MRQNRLAQVKSTVPENCATALAGAVGGAKARRENRKGKEG